jgi:hypothetical protein
MRQVRGKSRLGMGTGWVRGISILLYLIRWFQHYKIDVTTVRLVRERKTSNLNDGNKI